MPDLRQDVLDGYATHRDCGGRVRGHERCEWSWYDGVQCAKCGRKWGEYWLLKFSAQDLADRFVAVPRPTWSETLVLVWEVEAVTQRRYTRAVPLREAEGKERVL